jgi:DNA excision repair protein ERCC-4
MDNAIATSRTLRPVLEEQPKWKLLADILDEIERDVYFNPVIRDDSYGTTLMCAVIKVPVARSVSIFRR